MQKADGDVEEMTLVQIIAYVLTYIVFCEHLFYIILRGRELLLLRLRVCLWKVSSSARCLCTSFLSKPVPVPNAHF